MNQGVNEIGLELGYIKNILQVCKAEISEGV